MFRIIKSKNRGFTLIELMIVVAIIGILAAVAIPTFLDMMKSSKKGEAEVNLDAIKKTVKAGIADNSGFPVNDDGDDIDLDFTPADPCCDGDRKDRKCAPDADAWKGTDWDALSFNIDEAHYFQYSYSGGHSAFTATALGNLDCDETSISYELVGDYNEGNPTYTLTKPTRTD